MSGGQQRAIGLARALFRDAKILLLDEPTNDLDPDRQQARCTLHSLQLDACTVFSGMYGCAVLLMTRYVELLGCEDELDQAAPERTNHFVHYARVIHNPRCRCHSLFQQRHRNWCHDDHGHWNLRRITVDV